MNEELSKLIALLEELEFHGPNTRRYNENIKLIRKSVIGTHLEVICCNLFHYTDDSEIREKDAVYREMQNKELSKLIALLKKGNLEAALGINFFHDTSGL